METKTLFNFYEELETLNFDKRKAQGLVKRANNAGYDIYYAYHEDGADTWRYGWSSDDYKEDEDDVTLFEATNLIIKKKPTRSFQRAQTYTAECAIFIFCPLSTLLADPTLRERKINEVKNRVAINAETTYDRVIKLKNSFDLHMAKWDALPEENKNEILKLRAERDALYMQPNSVKPRAEKALQIQQLGGDVSEMPPLADWQKEILSFDSVENYIESEKEKAVKRLLSTVETETAGN